MGALVIHVQATVSLLYLTIPEDDWTSKMKGSTMAQWLNLLQTTGLCYGQQAPLLCLKLGPHA